METNSVDRHFLFFYIKNFTQKISPSLLKAFIVALSITFFVFLVELITFPYSDHDFALLTSYGAYGNYKDARWAADIFAILTRFESVPFICMFWGLVFKVAAGVLAVSFLTGSKDFVLLFCGGLYAGIVPEGLSFINFKFQSQIFSGAMLLCVFSFVLNEKENVKFFWSACILALFSIATYTSVLSMFGVLFFGKMLFDLLQGLFEKNIKSYIRMVLCVFIASTVQYMIVRALIHFKVIVEKYNVSTIALSDLPRKVAEVLRASFEYFYPFNNAAYMPAELKICVLLLAVFSLFVIVKKVVKQEKYKFRAIVTVCFISFCIIVSAKAAMILTPVGAYHAYRLNASGSIFLCIIIITALLFFCDSNRLQIASQLLILFIFYSCFVQDGLFQRRNHDQFIADTFFAQRVISHVENLEGFDIKKSYKYIFVGNMPYLAREKYASYNYFYSLEEFSRGLMMPWLPTALLQYVAPYMKVASLVTDLSPGKDPVLTYKVYQYAKKFSWPNSKFVKMLPDDTILIVLDNSEINSKINETTLVLQNENINIDEIDEL